MRSALRIAGRRGRSRLVALASVVGCGTFACVTGAGTAAKPTALELQLLGAYEELDEDLAAAASVRAAGLPANRSYARARTLALEARAAQRFNEDDLVELKDAGCLIETRRARLRARDCDLVEADPAAARRRERVIREENRARREILVWAAYELARQAGRPGPSDAELDELERTYQRLLLEAARPGHYVEDANGSPVQR